MVSARRVQPDLPRARVGMARARAVGARCRSRGDLPLVPVVQHTGEWPVDELTLLIYPDDVSRFEMYEDDGRSQAYRRGRFALTAFECATSERAVTVRIHAPTGDPSFLPPNRRYLLQLRGDRPVTIRVDVV